ncbi:hypothetical protein LIER_27673 [Lithospermum erythrorhizon]|uniref:DOG1 domain-containing protein n=1 Tax=Lithospermum erythrorhizon TaxID=34254 RepID=A0AAV3REJ9_LITER
MNTWRQTMKRAKSQPLLKFLKESDWEESIKSESKDEGSRSSSSILKQVNSMSINIKESSKRSEECTTENYGLWRNEQKARAARLEKHLKAKWALEELIAEQLVLFHAHCNKVMVPTKLKDVARLLMPEWVHPHELAALSWLGDWRPSAILDLLRSLATSSSSSAFSSLSADLVSPEGVLAQAVKEIRIEEAVIDEEMAEIQANCIMHLPFGPVNAKSSKMALACVHSEFEKVHRVITKAQNLRAKALDLVVEKLLGQIDAAEFVVVFTTIQEMIHQISSQQKLRNGPVSIPVKASGTN